ncbi:hypothetical protein BJF92_18290 [Rhizobium rhizosphaerae]|uniref:Thioesterase domain-containing protein n=1 Tax=Xaviernesmea rhizosphaerae TaxID=1672749 RepID=A0A1Q9ADJ1_9HYPH|nr:thioesterase domain-containing protein [Xaviernesmea rhizosphaerae]OLP52989.1 hypothetical protein BJF92_18290 [Xaviernesmea rhizosphaerae]
MASSRPLLLAFPPAGAGAGLFRSWVGAAPPAMAVHPVSLPGREARFSEPLPISIEALADQLAGELRPLLTGPYAILGYSMGALLGYETARRFQVQGLGAPEAFFALGCNAPDRMVLDRDPFHDMEPAAFRQALIDLGGMPLEILDNPEAMAVFEPVLRNDFRICETYRHDASRGVLRCPAHLLLCRDDAFVREPAAIAWSDFVTGGLTLDWIDGGHMIAGPVFDALPELVARRWLERAQDAQAGARKARWR